MRIFYRFLYLPSSIQAPDNFDFVRRLIYAVKDCAIWKPLLVNINGEDITITFANLNVLQEAVGSWISSYLKENGINGGVLVPVPSKEDLDATGNGKAYRRFASCMPTCADFTLIDALRFTERLPKASQGGPRFQNDLYPKLRYMGGIPAETPIILIDDIATSAGHIKACRQRLMDAGLQVNHAIVLGRTIYNVTDDPLVAGFYDVPDQANLALSF